MKDAVMGFYAYMLRCADGSYYVGNTSNVDGRVYQHQMGLLKGYTHGRRPVTLVWCEEFGSRGEAFQAEWRVKGWSRAKKEALIASDWERIQALAAIRAPDRRELETSSELMESSSPRPSSASGRELVNGSFDRMGLLQAEP